MTMRVDMRVHPQIREQVHAGLSLSRPRRSSRARGGRSDVPHPWHGGEVVGTREEETGA